jgi:integrase/recombinase XerD
MVIPVDMTDVKAKRDKGTEEKEILYPEIIRRKERYLERILENDSILDVNKEHARGFLKHCKAAKGLSEARICMYSYSMISFSRFAKKDFKEMTRADIDDYIVSLGKTGSTRDEYVKFLKVFYRYLNGLTSRDNCPEPVRHLERSKMPTKVNIDDLVTQKELDGMLSHTNSMRYRAIIYVLFETGLRPGELRALKIKDVTFNDRSIKLSVNSGKMAGRMGSRVVFVIRGYDALKSWFDNHTEKSNPDAWLFGKEGKPLLDPTLRANLKNIAKKAGINRRFWTYAFRHTYGTHVYKDLPTEMGRRLFGHAPGSAMPATYCHIDVADLEKAASQVQGVNMRQEAQQTPQNTFVCPRCSHVNGFGTDLCHICGYALNPAAAIREDSLDKIAEYLKILIRKNPKIANELKIAMGM